MRKFILFLICISFFSSIYSKNYTNKQIAQAIYYAEGAEKAKKPYGILSIPCNSKEECKIICLNSIKNAKKRYEKTDKSEDFLIFMGKRYCPDDFINWAKNVKFFLEKND